MNYTRTYSDLTELINRIFEDKFDCLNKSQRLLIERFNKYFKDELRFLIGISFFEINVLHALEIFRSNRYFIDALGIKLLPSLHKINKIINLSHDDKSIEMHIHEIIHCVTNNTFNKQRIENYHLTNSQI